MYKKGIGGIPSDPQASFMSFHPWVWLGGCQPLAILIVLKNLFVSIFKQFLQRQNWFS